MACQIKSTYPILHSLNAAMTQWIMSKCRYRILIFIDKEIELKIQTECYYRKPLPNLRKIGGSKTERVQIGRSPEYAGKQYVFISF